MHHSAKHVTSKRPNPYKPGSAAISDRGCSKTKDKVITWKSVRLEIVDLTTKSSKFESLSKQSCIS